MIDAAWALSQDPRALGRTFHLTDPSPFAARTVYELMDLYPQGGGMRPSVWYVPLKRMPGQSGTPPAPRPDSKGAASGS